jgi:ribonuclease HII
MRRALAALAPGPEYVLTDGFPVDGLGVPGLGVWKGDRVAACVAAASVLAKVTRDRIMVQMDGEFPGYGFADHKGYVTEEHSTALHHHGPCIQHRFSYANVAAAGRNVASSDVGGLQDAVVGSARSRRRSTVSVAAVVDPGGPADADEHQPAML